jgi:hypothetical protein
LDDYKARREIEERGYGSLACTNIIEEKYFIDYPSGTANEIYLRVFIKIEY